MNPNIFISMASRGISRASQSPDGDWRVESLLPDEDVRCLAVDPLNRSTVYAGTQGNGVLRSDDAGRTWRPAGLSGQMVKSLTVSPHEPGTLYAGTKPALLFVSRDGGTNWNELESFRRAPGRWFWRSPAEMPLTAYIQAIGLSPSDPRVIVVGIEAGAVLRSDDAGKTWSRHRPGALRDCHSLTFHVRDGNYVYEAGGTGAGASISRDGGQTWEQKRDGLDRHYGWACAADPARPDVWYASIAPMPSLLKPGPPPAHVDGIASAYIFRSMDGGPWQKLSGGLPQPIHYMAYGLVTDPDAPGHVYAGLSSGEVWHSTDYGDNWTQMPFNMQAVHRSMVILPAPNAG